MSPAIVSLVGVVGVILGALIAGAVTLLAKRNEYANDYYKTVIKRRITAYEQLENLIVALKTAVVDDDRRTYHFLFSYDDGLLRAYQLVQAVMSQGMWLTLDTFKKVRDLNYLIFSFNPDLGATIASAKEHYVKIAEIRSDLERLLAKDMLYLHRVRRFLKRRTKDIETGFGEISAGRKLLPPKN